MTTPLQTSVPPRVTFTHAGQTRTLNKHPRVQLGLRRGEMLADAAVTEPWYLRATLQGKARTFKLPAGEKDAIRAAKDILNGAVGAPTTFAEFVAEREARRGVTLGELADAWLLAGLPFSTTKTREKTAVERLKSTLDRALKWWDKTAVVAVTIPQMDEFVVWRRQHVVQGKGDRSAELELSALSSLCQWAVLTARIDENPFEKRPAYVQEDSVRHCHMAMPDNDDQFHAVLSRFFRDVNDVDTVLAGGWLAFSALSGLR